MIPYAAVLVGFLFLHNAWAAIAMYHAGMLATMLVFKNEKVSEPSSVRPSILHYLTTLIFASGGAIFYLVMPYFAEPASIANKLAEMGLRQDNWIYFAVYFCLVNSVIEELFWRGYLAPHTSNLHTDDLFFGGYHALVVFWFAAAYWALPVFVACAFAGWLWRQMRRVTGGLSLPILTHVAADISIVAAVHYRLFNG